MTMNYVLCTAALTSGLCAASLSTTQSTSAPCSGSSATSTQSAQYGVLSVDSYAVLNFANCGVEASGSAAFSDALTLFPNGGVSNGSVTFNLLFHFGHGFFGPGEVGGGSGYFVANTVTVRPFYSGDQILTIPFISGTPIPINGSASAYAYVSNGGGPFRSASGSGYFWLQSIQVFDGVGSQLTRYSYGSESGANYAFVGGVAIPEPSFTLLFAGLALAGMWWMSRQKSVFSPTILAEAAEE